MRDSDQIRRDQIDAGRAANAGPTGSGNTLQLKDRGPRPEGSRGRAGDNRPPRKAFVPKGHDAILARAQEAGTRMEIATMGGDFHVGTIVGRDRFTITLKCEGGKGGEERTFYKHAIEHFMPKGDA